LNINFIFANAIKAHQQGDTKSAQLLYKKILRNKPLHFDALHLLGVCYFNDKKFEESKEYIKRALIVNNQFSEAHFNLGNTLLALDDLEGAKTAFQKAIDLKANYIDAYNNLGTTLRSLCDFHEAQRVYEIALEIQPSARLWYNYGNVLSDQNLFDEAKKAFEMAIDIDPQHFLAWNSLGDINASLGQLREAEKNYYQAIRLEANFADAYSNLGNVLSDLGRSSEAEKSCRKAIELKPDFAEPYNNLGNALKEMGYLSEAEINYRKAIELKPDFAIAYSNLLLCLNYIESKNITESLKDAVKFGSIISSRAIPKFTAWNRPTSQARLRIGFVSGDLKNHPVGYFIEGLLQHLNKDQFEIFAFPTKHFSDELTTRLKKYVNEWIPIYGESDRDAATLIHQKGIQILFDLSGHTAHNRLTVFSYKPAPVQVSWLGYFASTGLPEIDYLLGDPYVTPKTEEHHFSEKVWRLPESYICFAAPIEQIAVYDLPVIQNQFITFGCFNNLSKMSDQVVKTWASILTNLSSSKLLLKTNQLNDPTVVQEVYKKFASNGITPNRLLLEGSSPRAELLAAYNKVDIALDPFPYPGGTTSLEALWMGVPVLTLKGDRFLSHVGESIAHNVGHIEWIAKDLDDYVRKAISFAADIENLSELRRCLRDKALKSPLFNSKNFSNHFNKVVLAMWESHSQDDIKS